MALNLEGYFLFSIWGFVYNKVINKRSTLATYWAARVANYFFIIAISQ
jgi:hypothetical protein